MQTWTDICTMILDPVLGGLRHWRPDVCMGLIALAVAVLGVAIRRFVAPQDLLRRAAADRKRLRALVRLARAQGNAADVWRYRHTRHMIRARTRRGRWLGTFVWLGLVALGAGWCAARLTYHASSPGEPIEVRLIGPASAVGDVAHIVPMDALASDGWIRKLRPTREVDAHDDSLTEAAASWHLSGSMADHPYEVLFRHEEGTFRHALWIGTQGAIQPIVAQHPGWRTEVMVEPVRFLGPVGPVRLLGVPAWLIGYVLLALVAGGLLRRLLRIR